jgi:hypothetical protein
MIIKGERLPFSMNLVSEDTLPIERVGINWDEEFSFYQATGKRPRKRAKEVIESAKAKRKANREIKRLERVADRQTKKALKIKKRRNNREILSEDKISKINLRIERAEKKAQAAKDKAKQLRDKATEETQKAPTSAAASAANFAAKIAERKAEEQQKKAEEEADKGEKEENKIVKDLQKDVAKIEDGAETTQYDEIPEKDYIPEELFIQETEQITPDNFEGKSDNPPGEDGGIPWWGWALIGTAGLGIIGTIIYFVAKKGK